MAEHPALENEIRDAFLKQAEACEVLGSHFTARICTLMAERLKSGASVQDHILNWPGDPSGKSDALALRLAGSLHALVLEARDPDLSACYPPRQVDDETLWLACEQAMCRHEDFLLNRLQSAPQTNEVRRSGALLPGFLTIAALTGKPLVLSEIGSSAGLNLQWDSYGYRLGSMAWGDRDCKVQIEAEWTGKLPPLTVLKVLERAGCDLNPLDAASHDDRIRMLSYIWADQTDRLQRTRDALEMAAGQGVNIERADAVDWLGRRLAQRFEGATHVIFHSITWQYLPNRAKDAGRRLIDEAGKTATPDSPIAWLKMESDDQPDGAAITLQLWPEGESHVLGRADYHGRWVKWHGWPEGGT